MKKIIGGLVALGVAAFAVAAWAQGVSILTTLTGTEIVSVQSGPLNTGISATNLSKFDKTSGLPAVVLASQTTSTLNPAAGNLFTLTPGTNINLVAASAPTGAVDYVVITTSGVTSYNVVPSTGFKSTGTLATGTSSGKVFVITFVGDGTNMNEVSRTTAQ